MCGNNVCESWRGETHATCPSDCAPPACQSQGCGNRCGQWIDNCGALLNCGPCSALCAKPNGVCEPGLGENPLTCPNECDDLCGNGRCDYLIERVRCPADCASPDQALVTAGGPYQGSVGAPVAFHAAAVAPGTSVTSYEWTFGDGTSANGRAVTHAYALLGTYNVRVRARLGTGLVLTADTTAAIGVTTPSGACNPCLSGGLRYDPILDVLRLHMRVSYTPPGAGFKAFLGLSIENPAGSPVYRLDYTQVGEHEVGVEHVPSFGQPQPGLWKTYARVVVADTFGGTPPQPFDWFVSIVVPQRTCNGCVHVSPTEESSLDGESRAFAAGWPGQASVGTWQWRAEKPPGAGSEGGVTFEGNGSPNVNARATWFPRTPELECPSGDALREQVSPGYTVRVDAQAGTTIGNGLADLRVTMPWGMPSDAGGTGRPAAVTKEGTVVGDFPLYNPECSTTPVPNSCHVIQNRWTRDVPRTYFDMPASSSFRPKLAAHEAVHREQFTSGIASHLWSPDALYARVSTLSANSAQDLDDLIADTFRDFDSVQRQALGASLNAMECEAHAVSDQRAPRHLLQRCVVRPDVACSP